MKQHTPLIERWKQEAQLYDRRGLTEFAALVRSFVAEVEMFDRERALEALTLEQAASESGYTAPHLGQLVRDGQIENVGRPGAPRIRRADLPKKFVPRATPRTSRGEPDLVAKVFGGSANSGEP